MKERYTDEEFLTLCIRCKHNCKQGEICKGYVNCGENEDENKI